MSQGSASAERFLTRVTDWTVEVHALLLVRERGQRKAVSNGSGCIGAVHT